MPRYDPIRCALCNEKTEVKVGSERALQYLCPECYDQELFQMKKKRKTPAPSLGPSGIPWTTLIPDQRSRWRAQNALSRCIKPHKGSHAYVYRPEKYQKNREHLLNQARERFVLKQLLGLIPIKKVRHYKNGKVIFPVFSSSSSNHVLLGGKGGGGYDHLSTPLEPPKRDI